MIPDSQIKFKNNIHFAFDGGDMTSDGGVFLLMEFIKKIGLKELIDSLFYIKGDSPNLEYKSQLLLLQFIVMTCIGYPNQSHAGFLKKDPALTDCFDGVEVASQPTFSRFHNRLTEATGQMIEEINGRLVEMHYEWKPPKFMIQDLDTSYFDTDGNQEGKGFNAHYQTEGLSPLFLFDNETGLYLKGQLRSGTTYCSKEAADFLRPVLKKQQKKYGHSISRLLRGDSGFASPEIYEVCEETGTAYLIRLKQNAVLVRKAEEIRLGFHGPFDIQNTVVLQGEFKYQAGSWGRERRVAVEISRQAGQLVWDYMFLVTDLETEKLELIFSLYRKRGSMENFIKEAKNGFRVDKVSQKSLASNGTQMQAKMLAYNLIRLFTLNLLPEKFQSHQVETLRNKFFKLAGKRVKSGRRVTYRFASAFPYQNIFRQILVKISHLK